MWGYLQYCRALAFGCAWILGGNLDSQEPSPGLETTTASIEEAVRKWTSYQEQLNGFEITVRGENEVFKTAAKGRRLWSTRVTIDENGERVLIEGFLRPASKRRKTIEGGNPQYCFDLKETEEEEDTSWLLRDVERSGNDAAKTAALLRRARRLVNPGLWLAEFDYFLPDFISAPGFVLRESRMINVKGDELFEINFQFTPADPLEPFINSGTLHFDPQREWLLQEADLTVANVGLEPPSGRIRLINRIQFVDDAVPAVVERQQIVYTDNIDSPYRREIRKYDIKRVDADPDLFTLTHFGLPEPKFEDPTSGRRFRRFAMLLSFGVILLMVIGVFLLQIRSRANKR